LPGGATALKNALAGTLCGKSAADTRRFVSTNMPYYTPFSYPRNIRVAKGEFYTLPNGEKPVKVFLDSLDPKLRSKAVSSGK
jgi:hypothetical protein